MEDRRRTVRGARVARPIPALFAAIREAVAPQAPDIPIVPYMTPGATDGKHFRARGIPTYGFSADFTVGGEVAGVHGLNERIPERALYEAFDFWPRLMRQLARGSGAVRTAVARRAACLARSASPRRRRRRLQSRSRPSWPRPGRGCASGWWWRRWTGRRSLAINPDGRFVPASNTKLFTTIAAYELLPGLAQPDAASGDAGAGCGRRREGVPDVILEGRGDARLSSAPDCRSDCLATLADAVAARTRRVGCGDRRCQRLCSTNGGASG